MKKIDSYFDQVTKIKTNIYQTEEGLRVVESINKNTVDFDISFVVNAGAYYEEQLGVPFGTAHLLEHLPFGNPNKFLKTKKEFVEYQMGNKKRASFESNAYTTREFMYLYAHGHENAKIRMIKYLTSQLLYPLENFSKYIDKEKNIVIEEKNRRPIDEKWSALQYDKKIFGKEFAPYDRDIIGEVKDIKEITANDLIKFYNSTFTTVTSVLAIQTSKKLNKEEIDLITSLSSSLNKANPPKKLTKIRKGFKPDFRIYTFKNEQSREIFMSFNYFYELKDRLETDDEYIKDRLFIFLTDLINKVSYDYIREDLGLTYDISAINDRAVFKNKNRGFSLNLSFSNLGKVLEGIYQMIEFEFEKFLKSAEGKRWFDNILSFYIYHRNNEHDEDYAEDIAIDLLDNSFIKFDYKRAKSTAKKLSPEVLLNFTKKFFKIPPIIWVNSSYDEKEILDIIKKSKIYKKYS